MRASTCILAIAALCFASFNDCVVILTFTLNRSYIAANLCEQRTIPGNSCRGCCQLRKQLNNTEKQQRQDLPSKNHNDLQLFLLTAEESSVPRSSSIVSYLSAPFLPTLPCRDVDHPPNAFPV